MIKYLKNHFIDRFKYDQCIKLDETGIIYGLSWYMDIICEEWDALVLNDYDAVWPLPLRYKWGVKYFYRPYAVQQLGIFTKKPLNPSTLEEFIKALKQHCQYADVYLNEGQVLSERKVPLVKFMPNRNMMLDVSCSYQDIYNGFNTNTRRNIKASQKSKLQLFEQDGPEVLVRLFKDNKAKDLKLSDSFYRNIEKAMYHCLHHNCGRVWTVYGGPNIVVAGAFITEFSGRATLLFTALDSGMGKELKAMFFLINEFLIYYSTKLRLFDFEGSNDDNLVRFYGGFGAEEKTYYNLKYNGLPWPLKLMKN